MARVDGKAPHQLSAGEYCRWADDGAWYCVPPGTDLVANLSGHQVDEHADGTITVSPSILVSDGRESWHGHLSRGRWEKC